IMWTPSPSDNAQVVSQMLYEIRRLDDGLQERAMKTDLDLLTGEFTTFTNDYISTSEYVEQTLQAHDDWLESNGSTLLQTADLVDRKVWLNDVSEIGANLIPFSDISNQSNRTQNWTRFGSNTSGSHATALDSDGFFVIRDVMIAETFLGVQSVEFDGVVEGETYTLSYLAKTHATINDNYNYTYILNPNGTNHSLGLWTNRTRISGNIYRYEWTFSARWTGVASVLIGSMTEQGADARIRFKEPKLEVGSVRTPYMNALSHVEQMANSISMQGADFDGEFIRQSSLEINSEYWQLGATRMGAEN